MEIVQEDIFPVKKPSRLAVFPAGRPRKTCDDVIRTDLKEKKASKWMAKNRNVCNHHAGVVINRV